MKLEGYDWRFNHQIGMAIQLKYHDLFLDDVYTHSWVQFRPEVDRIEKFEGSVRLSFERKVKSFTTLEAAKEWVIAQIVAHRMEDK